MFGSVEGEGREEKGKGKGKEKEWGKKVFHRVCLDRYKKRNERCEILYNFIILNYKLIRIQMSFHKSSQDFLRV